MISFCSERRFSAASSELTRGDGLCAPLCAAGEGPHSLAAHNRDSRGVGQVPHGVEA